MRTACVTAFASMCALSATHAQDLELLVTIAPTGAGDRWSIDAELLNPTGTIRAVIADLSFRMEGTGFSDWEYNTAFDSDFLGPPTRNSVSDGVIEFTGSNVLPPLNNPGGPDNSNPLNIGTFDATDVTSFDFDGYTTGAPVSPMDIIWTYVQSNGDDGDTPYRIVIVPAPSSAGVLVFGGVIASRRRR